MNISYKGFRLFLLQSHTGKLVQLPVTLAGVAGADGREKNKRARVQHYLKTCILKYNLYCSVHV